MWPHEDCPGSCSHHGSIAPLSLLLLVPVMAPLYDHGLHYDHRRWWCRYEVGQFYRGVTDLNLAVEKRDLAVVQKVVT